jgi:hypothetical protein
LVVQGMGRLMASGEPELFVGRLEVAFDGSHGEVPVVGDLFVGASGNGL